MTDRITPHPTLHIVIVNYRTAPLVIDCLASLWDQACASRTRVSVVDNASGDGSAQVIAAAIATHGWADRVELIASAGNGGFAAGNNLAIRAALAGTRPPDLFWLLNPDTRVAAGAIAAVLGFFAAHPQAGIAGTALIEENGEAWPFAFRFPTILSEAERGARLRPLSWLLGDRAVPQRMGGDAAPVDWVSGASMIVRRAVFESVGLMDEGYFLYYEETDFCLRAQRGGWQCWFVPQAAVMHIAGQSTGVTAKRAVPARLPGYWFDSRRRYFVANHGRAYAVLADLAWMVAHLTWRLRRSFKADPAIDPPALLGDFLRGSALVSGAARRR